MDSLNMHHTKMLIAMHVDSDFVEYENGKTRLFMLNI